MSEARASALVVLRVRDFRLYWSGLVAQVGGQHMFQFTLGWLAFEITGSQAQLAIIHLCAFVPQFTLTMLGGVLADRIDPRRLIQVAQAVAAAGVILVGVMALLDLVVLWHLALGSFLLGLSNAVDEPCRAAFFPRLLPKSLLRSAVPLISMAFGGARIVAPSIAGFLIAAAGASTTFLVSAIGISSMIAMLFMVRPGAGVAPAHGSLLANFADSLRYIRANEVFSKVILAAMLNAMFAMGYHHMLPVFAKDVLLVDARGLGILASAVGVGALTGLLSYPWWQARLSPRNLMVASMTAYCLALLVLAFSDWFWLSVAMCFVAGLNHAGFMTSCQVVLQTLVEDNYRGRVMGVFTQVWSLLYLSGFLLNFAGSLMGPRLALAAGSLVVLACVWMSLVRSAALRALTLAPRAS
ncbi:MAG: MFS transporter [Burkholderiales bacterium]|nr:MFS transporter [Burkholderiales bacterium]